MGAAFVQKAFSSPGGTPSSVTATFSAGVGSGNLVVGSCTYGSTTSFTASAIADNHGVNPVLINTLADANGPTFTATFYFKNVTNGMTSVTFTPPSAAGVTAIFIHEASGLDTVSPLDTHNLVTDDTGHNPEVSPSITPSANGAYVYAALVGPITGFAGITSVSSPYTLENKDTSGSPVGGDAQQVQTTAAATTCSFNMGAVVGYMTATIAFKVAGGGASLPPGTQSFDTPQPDSGTSRFPPQLRHFDAPDRLRLVNQDKVNPGKQSYDTPAAWLAPETFAQWRAFSWQRSANLQGLDKRLPGQQTNYLPTGVTWQPDSPQQNLLNTVLSAAPPRPPGKQLYDRWIDPQDSFAQWRAFSWDRSPNLIFQDSFPVGAIWDDLSPSAPQRGIDFEPTVNIALLTTVVVPPPPGQQLYANPPPPLDPWAQWRAFAGWYNLNLIGRDQFAPGVQTNYLPFGVSWRTESPQQNLSNTLLALQARPPGAQLYDNPQLLFDAFAQWRAWANFNVNLTPPPPLLPPPPGQQLYGLPPFGYPPLVPSYAQFNVNLFPPPPPPTITAVYNTLLLSIPGGMFSIPGDPPS